MRSRSLRRRPPDPPSTAYRRFARWTRAGLFDQLHLVLLDQLGEAGSKLHLGVDSSEPW
jgi:transposase